MAYSKARRLADIVVDTNGNINVPTQSASDNDTSAASTAYVTTAVSGLIDSAPDTLNTLNEIAAALNDDANFNTTVTNSIAAKLPLAGGTLTGDLTISEATPTITFTDTDNNYDATIAGLSGSLVLKADANAEFGTETIQFHTGGSQRATINSSGNFGIGTSDPAAKLHISGNSDVSDADCMLIIDDVDGSAGSRIPAIMFRSHTSGTVTNQGRIRGTGTLGMILSGSSTLGDDLVVSGSSGLSRVSIGTTTQSADGLTIGTVNSNCELDMTHTSGKRYRLRSNSDGTFKIENKTDSVLGLCIKSDGNVGIGTSSPSRLLDIENSTAGGSTLVSLVSATDGNVQLLMGDTSSDTQGKVRYDNSSDIMALHTNGSERLRIDSSGNVGIGESSPQTPLHISKDSASGENIALQIDNNNTTAGNRIGMLFRSRVGTTNTDFIITGIANAANEMDLVFQSDGSTERMRIDSSGRVGIGTTSPNQKLNVSGGRSYFGANGEAFAIGLGFNGTRTANNQTYFLGATDSATPDLQISNADGNEKVRITHAGNIGIGTTSPSKLLHIKSADPVIRLEDSSPSAYAEIDGAGGDLIISCDAGDDDSNSVIQFKVDNSEKMRIDSNGDVAIGTTGGNGRRLEVATANDFVAKFESTDAGSAIIIEDSNSTDNGNRIGVTTNDMHFTTNSSERMRLDASGNLGLGETSPSAPLDIAASSAGIELQTTDNTSFGYLNFGDPQDNNIGQILYDHGSNYMRFQVNNSEKVRIDASGNLGLGTASPSTNNAQLVSFKDGGSFAYLGHNNSGGTFPKVSALSFGSSAVSFTHTTNGGTNALTGSAQIAAIQSASSNAVTDMAFYTTSGGNVAERLRIDSAGTVIFKRGTIDGFINPTGASLEFDVNRNPETGVFDSASRSHARIIISGADGGSHVQFNTANANNTVASERGRFHKDGHFLINTTSNQGVGGYTFEKGGLGIITHNNNNGASGGYEFSIFRRSSVQIGSIAQNGTTGIQLNTSSDARLKDVTGSARGLDVINNLNPVAYNWKADNRADEGLIAQEVEKVMPNAVSQTKDGYYMMDYSKLVTPLVKAIQEQQEQIESLKSEIANLKEK